MKNSTFVRTSINTKSDLNLNPEFTEFAYLSGYNVRKTIKKRRKKKFGK